ncbi:MAG: hypothetical protein ACRC5C_13680, partial [Bacilli bacterium]
AVGFFKQLANALHFIVPDSLIPHALFAPFASGILEITLGSQLIATSASPIVSQGIAVAFLLGFSGLSVLAQVATIVADTDLSMRLFVRARILHGIFSAVWLYALWKPLYEWQQFDGESTAISATLHNGLVGWLSFTQQVGPLMTIGTLVFATVWFAKSLAGTSKTEG